jgi:CBS-domain-containing membrane protein
MPVPAVPPRRSLRADLTLALMPTVTVLLVFALVDTWSRQRLLFASLASSAFLVYLDPDHEVNSVRTLVLAQGSAALVGFAAHTLLGASFWTAGAAMIVVIFGMILARVMHPPAVSTALSFALGAGTGRGLLLFAVCVGVLVGLVFLQRAAVRLLVREG